MGAAIGSPVVAGSAAGSLPSSVGGAPRGSSDRPCRHTGTSRSASPGPGAGAATGSGGAAGSGAEARATAGVVRPGVSASAPPRSTSSSARRASTGRARWTGSFSSIASSAGTSGPALSYGEGGSCTTFDSVSIASPPENGARPSTAAYSVAPRPHMSAGAPASRPLTISGAM